MADNHLNKDLPETIPTKWPDTEYAAFNLIYAKSDTTDNKYATDEEIRHDNNRIARNFPQKYARFDPLATGEKAYLVDDHVNGYLKCIKNMYETENRGKKCCIIHSHNWRALNHERWRSAKTRMRRMAKSMGIQTRIINKLDKETNDTQKDEWTWKMVQSTDIILIPIHSHGNHWRLGVITVKKHPTDQNQNSYSYALLDSWPASDGKAKDTETMEIKETLTGKKWDRTKDSISTYRSNTQPNKEDCGVFLAINAIQIIRGMGINTECVKNESESRAFKNRIAIDLTRGEILHTLTWLTGTEMAPCKQYSPQHSVACCSTDRPEVSKCRCGHPKGTHQSMHAPENNDHHQIIDLTARDKTQSTHKHQKRKRTQDNKRRTPLTRTISTGAKKKKPTKNKVGHTNPKGDKQEREGKKEKKPTPRMTNQKNDTIEILRKDNHDKYTYCPEIKKIAQKYLHTNCEINTSLHGCDEGSTWWSKDQICGKFGAKIDPLTTFLKCRATWANFTDNHHEHSQLRHTIEGVIDQCEQDNDQETKRKQQKVEQREKKRKGNKAKTSERNIKGQTTINWRNKHTGKKSTTTKHIQKQHQRMHNPTRVVLMTRGKEIINTHKKGDNHRTYTIMTMAPETVTLYNDKSISANIGTKNREQLQLIVVESIRAPPIDTAQLKQEISCLYGDKVEITAPKWVETASKGQTTTTIRPNPTHYRPTQMWYKDTPKLTPEESAIDTPMIKAYINMHEHNTIIGLLGAAPNKLRENLQTMGHNEE